MMQSTEQQPLGVDAALPAETQRIDVVRLQLDRVRLRAAPPVLDRLAAPPGGHGAALSLNTHGHVFAEFEDVPRVNAEDAIRDACARLCPAASEATPAATGS